MTVRLTATMIACAAAAVSTAHAGDCTPVHLRTNGSGIAPTCWDQQDETCTDGNLFVANNAQALNCRQFPLYDITGLRITLSEPTVVSDLNGIGGAADGNFWQADFFELTINVFSTPEAFADYPCGGDVVNNRPAVLATNPPEQFGGTSFSGFTYFHVDASFDPFVLPAGEYIISLKVLSDELFSWALSDIDAGCDISRNGADPIETWIEFCDFPCCPATAAVDVLG